MKRTVSVWSLRDRRALSQLNQLGRLLSVMPSGPISIPDITNRYTVLCMATPRKCPLVNGYLIQDTHTGSAIMIDSGSETIPRKIDRLWSEVGIDPTAIVWIGFTHGDIDHVATAYSTPVFCGIPKWLGAGDATLTAGGVRTRLMGVPMSYGPTLPPDPDRIYIKEGIQWENQEKMPGIKVESIGCPGHTPGSMVFRVEMNGERRVFYFTGDALRLQSPLLAVTDLDHKQNWDSLGQFLLPRIKSDLDAGLVLSVFTGHAGVSHDGAAVAARIERSVTGARH